MTASVLKSRKLKDQSDRNVVETGTKTFLLNLESSQGLQKTLYGNMSGIILRTLFFLPDARIWRGGVDEPREYELMQPKHCLREVMEKETQRDVCVCVCWMGGGGC